MKADDLFKGVWKLPWTINTAPHCVVDILRGCNVKCKACYNSTARIHFKQLDEIKKDYELFTKLRPLSSVGLIGGEPLMHPQLFEVIKFFKSKNLSIEIFTNGLLLTEELCKKLAQAGVNLIFLHIDLGQKRSDLKDNYSLEEVQNLRNQKAMLVCNAGMEAAMSVTLQKSALKNYPSLVDYFLRSRSLTYFLTTCYRDTKNVGHIRGNIQTGFKGNFSKISSPEELKMEDVYISLTKLGMVPYAAVMGRHDKQVPRWLTLMSAVAYDSKGATVLNLSPSSFEEKFVTSYYKKHGYYPFYNKQNPFIARLQILFNGIFSHHFKANFSFLIKNMHKKILIKRLLIQNPAYLMRNGELEHCECCPDITVKDGKLVPVCMCDNLIK